MKADERSLLPVLSAVAAAGFVLVAALATGEPTALDSTWIRALRTGGRPAGPAWLPPAAVAFTTLGNAAALNVWIAATGALLAWTRHLRLAAWFLGVAYGGLVFGWLLKLAFRRPRPALLPAWVDLPASWSFPSGHALDAMVVFLSMAVAVHRSGASRLTWRITLGLALGATFVMGLTRVYLGVHYPTDVLGGWLAGLAWVLAWMRVAPALVPEPERGGRAGSSAR